MADIGAKDLNEALQKGAARAIQLDKALGLTYYVVRDGKLYAITPDGKKHFLKKALFGARIVKEKRIKLKNE